MKKQLTSVIAMLMCLTCFSGCDVVNSTKDFFVDGYNKVEGWVGGLLGDGSGEEKPEPEPEPEPEPKFSVALDKTALTLDRYEDDTLVATVTDENGEAVTEEVTWTSSNPEVATVVNGFVEATGVGSATITATVDGGVAATCEVTVEDSGALPVLNVGEDTVEVLVGETYSLDASVVYKRQPVEGATVTYQSSDSTVASIDENGVITAHKYGTVTLTVSANWKNVDALLLTETITLNVKEDVAVEIQATEGATIYTSAITVDGTEFTNTATFTANVLLGGSADGVDASKISWASSDPNVLTVENGVVTAVGEGKANVTVSYTTDAQTYVSSPVEVTVSFPVVKKDVKVYLDASKGTIDGQITANQVFGSDATIAKIYESDDGEDLKESTTWLKENDVGSETERTKTIVVSNGQYGYEISALVITKVITTAQELASLQTYSEVTEGSAGTTYYSYGGYFVLANNIVATGEEAPFKALSMGSIGSGGHATAEAGFHGTFDGQGYTIKGFKVDIGGIFGDIGDGAVIKNVAFEDCNAAWRNFTAAEPVRQDGVGVLAANAAGNYLIENVFVESTGNGANAAALIGRSTKGGTIKNTVIIYNATGGWSMGAISSWWVAPGTLENVYVIMQGKTAQAFGNDANIANGVVGTSTYKVVTATEDPTAIEYTNLPSDYWFVEAGMVPVFKTMIDELVLSQTEVSVAENGEVKLTASLKDIAGGVITNKAVWTSSNEEVATVENGVLTIKGVGTVTITATFGGYTATCEVEITEAKLPVEDKTSVKLTLEAKNTKSLTEQVIAEGVKAGLFEAFEVTSVTDANGNPIDTATYLGTADANNNREATLIVYAADKGYKVNALVITKIITSVEELTKLQEYAGVTTVDASYNANYPATYYNYGGYFVLGNDIIVKDTDPVISANCLEQMVSGSQIKEENGFSGVFDGRGYSIVNARFGAGGLLGDVSKNGVIKNVAFVDATITEEAKANAGAGVISFSFCGSAEDVFVSYTTLKARNGAFGRVTKGGSLKNVVVYYKKSGGYNGGAIACVNNSQMKTENVYVVYANGMAVADCKVTGEQTANYSQAVVEIQESALASATFSVFNTDTWYIADGVMPIFKSAIGNLTLDASGEVEIELGKELSFTAGVQNIGGSVMSYVPVTWVSSDETVAMVENGVLMLLKEGTTTISASFGTQTKSVVVNVVKGEFVIQDKTSVVLYLESSASGTLNEQLFAQAQKAGLFSAFATTKVVEVGDEETDLSADANWIKNVDVAGTGREKILIVYGENVAFKVSVMVVTKAITTAQELVDILNYATNVTVTTAGEYQTYSYGGYFVLGNNLKQDSANPITFAGPSIGAANDNKTVNIGSQSWVIQDGTAGFHGTFDGQGYSIDGFSYGVGGVFGFIGSGAVIKNVAFTNCATGDNNNNTRNESVLAQGAIGAANNKWLIDNVYVQGTMNGIYSGMMLGYFAYDGTISNTVAQIKFTGSISGIGSISHITNNGFAVNNFVGVYEYDAGRYGRDYKPFGKSDTFKTPTGTMAEYELKDGAVRKITDKTYTGSDIKPYTVAESAPTAEEFATFSSTYWTVEAGKAPVFKAKN